MYGNEPPPFRGFERHQQLRQQCVADDKTLDAKVSDVVARERRHIAKLAGRSPNAEHPSRTPQIMQPSLPRRHLREHFYFALTGRYWWHFAAIRHDRWPSKWRQGKLCV